MARKKKPSPNAGLISTNRTALRDFHILEKFEAGIQLRGTEVKSIRRGKINLRDAFCRVEKSEVFLHGCDIQPYEAASFEQHSAKRPRRLLLHRREINKLKAATAQKGLTIVALNASWKDNRFVKIEIGVAKGKADHDKREDIKERVELREAQREVMRFNRSGSL